MRTGLSPAEAVEALKRFQAEYEIRARKMETFQAGEALFALPKTEYPEMVRTKKELELLGTRALGNSTTPCALVPRSRSPHDARATSHADRRCRRRNPATTAAHACSPHGRRCPQTCCTRCTWTW